MKLSFSIDAPLNSWIESTMSPKVKTMKGQRVGARSLACNILGVERHVGAPRWGLRQEFFWCTNEPRANIDS
jgi:hypothetical protein